MASVRIPKESVESLEHAVEMEEDPHDFVVEYAITAADARPTVWVLGDWAPGGTSGDWTARTPTLGGIASGASVELGEDTWKVWWRITDLPEIPVHELPNRVVVY